jgi:PhoPQ-activated pathogenicity-related protein
MRTILPLLLLLSAITAPSSPAWSEDAEGPLRTYVQKPDDSFRWVVRRQGNIGSTPYAELILTSQTWRDIPWKHQVFLFRPSDMTNPTHHALLYISGGSWREELQRPPTDDSIPGEARAFARLADILGTPVAVLRHVPHQPLLGGLYEDQIISLTFEKFIRTGDPQWPLLLPMVKSAVRGMDTAQEYCQQQWGLDVKTFTVTGASKRGWTTWLVGAVDSRAVALAPMVIDVLNMSAQMDHQLAAWGDYSYKIRDYTARDLPRHLDTPGGKKLVAIVDPYSYRHVLTQPKLILIGTNDHYWPIDALSFYWNELRGDKYILYVPNNGHGLKDNARVVGSIRALHQHVARSKPLPKLRWDFAIGKTEATLRIESDISPRHVRLWAATSDTRDFRDARWQSYPMEKTGKAFVGTLQRPPAEFGAMFGEAVYDTDGTPYFLSTNVRVAVPPSEDEEVP